MNYPEEMPNSHDTQHPITELEIVKQQRQIEAHDALMHGLVANQAFLGITARQEQTASTSAEEVKRIGDLLSGGESALKTGAMDSSILNSNLRSKDTE